MQPRRGPLNLAQLRGLPSRLTRKLVEPIGIALTAVAPLESTIGTPWAMPEVGADLDSSLTKNLNIKNQRIS